MLRSDNTIFKTYPQAISKRFFCFVPYDFFRNSHRSTKTLLTPLHFFYYCPHFLSQSARELSTRLKIGVGVFSSTLSVFFGQNFSISIEFDSPEISILSHKNYVINLHVNFAKHINFSPWAYNCIWDLYFNFAKNAITGSEDKIHIF